MNKNSMKFNPKRFGVIVLVTMSLLPFSGDVRAGKFGMGYVKDSEEVYQATPKVPRYRAFLPSSFDLSSGFPKPGYQGQQGSCVGWSTAYAIRSYYEAKRQKWDLNNEEHLFSPSFVYNKLRPEGQGCVGPTRISDALVMLQSEGVPSIASFPYKLQDCNDNPNAPEVLAAASPYKIKEWRRFEVEKIDDIKGQIHAGNPVVFGLNLSHSFEDLKQNDIYDDAESPRIGGHAMVLVGYSDEKQAFKFINSWGTDWGDNGFGWVSYRAFKLLCDQAYVMQVPKEAFLVATTGTIPAISNQQQVIELQEIKPPIINPPEHINPNKTPEHVVQDSITTHDNHVVQDSITNQNNQVNTVVVQVAPEPEKVAPPVKPVAPQNKPEVVKPRPLKVAEIKSELDKQLNSLECASIKGVVATNSTIAIKGYVSSREDLKQLEGSLSNLPGVNGIKSDVLIRPWPQCEALLTFDPAISNSHGLSVTIKNGKDLFENDKMVIDVKSPNYPSYLYVTYLQANGEAVHIAKPSGHFPKPTPPNKKITFGETGQTYRVGPPFGEEMVVVIASKSRLFGGELMNSEMEREYLSNFRKVFLSGSRSVVDRGISAATATLTTHEK